MLLIPVAVILCWISICEYVTDPFWHPWLHFLMFYSVFLYIYVVYGFFIDAKPWVVIVVKLPILITLAVGGWELTDAFVTEPICKAFLHFMVILYPMDKILEETEPYQRLNDWVRKKFFWKRSR